MQTIASHKVLLIILDGFGINEKKQFNAIANAKMPNWQKLIQKYAFTQINASGKFVGLPEHQFGNSEVGHLNIGAGRIVEQDITRINSAIQTDTLKTNPILTTTLTKTTNSLHIMGLLSDGGVHSHIQQIFSLINIANTYSNLKKIWLHIFLDGRDTPPKSAIIYINLLLTLIEKFPKITIATISGRYYAMDRDRRFERTQLTYNAITFANGDKFNSAIDVINSAYKNNITDEFIKPCVNNSYNGLEENDSMIFANYRSDRAIQLTKAFIDNNFNSFKTKKIHLSSFITMTQYDKHFTAKVLFPPNNIQNTLGEYIANLGLHQLRIAETEKYPHVTYFLNGGNKEPFINETRILIDSPKDVATYDLKPEMSLPKVVDTLIQEIKINKYDFIITNFANGDMVGHSGNYTAAIHAVEAIDDAIGKCVKAMQEIGGEVLITADHGNCEEMYDNVSHQPHTQHTSNLVPLLYIGRPAKMLANGSLQDVAPTLLAVAGLNKPHEMTGQNLIQFIK